MLGIRPLYLSLVVAAIFLMLYSAINDFQGLLSSSVLLLFLATSGMNKSYAAVPLLVYAAVFLVSLVLPNSHPSVEKVLSALLTIIGLGALILREQNFKRELSWQRNINNALSIGSERLNEAMDSEGITGAGISMLDQLNIAPNIAFVAYRHGTPMILASRGAFENHAGKPIHPSDNNTLSVQADHWVAEEVLGLLKRDDRRRYLVISVYGRANTQTGVLVLTRPKEIEFSQEERNVVTSFSRILGAQLGQYNAIRELGDANELTLRSLGAALERRDDETSGHTTRVVTASVQLAQQLGWDESQVKALRWGAYLHDLGKIAIPDRILHKPGRLDQEERLIMQSHSSIGYDLLQDLHFLPAETLDLVKYHHEYWDGTGYPAGLRGQNIPATARIFSVVDVYDALTSTRPYKEPWSKERALNELRSKAGIQFDPNFVASFIQMMEEQDDAKLVP